MSPVPPWSRRPILGLLALGVGMAVLGTILVTRAGALGLVPAGVLGDPDATWMYKAGLGLGIALLGGLVLGWRFHGRRNDLWISRRREELATRQLNVIREVVLGYAQRRGSLPLSLEQAGLSDRYLINPWGRPYLYCVHDDRFTISTDMPVRLAEYFALEKEWLAGPGDNALTWH